MNDTVTFQTVLDTGRETPKSFKIFTGSYLPKSLVTIEVLWNEDRKASFEAKKAYPVQVVNVTMPTWFQKKM